MLLENWLLGHSLLVLLSLGTVFNLCWLWICRDRVRFSRWTVPLLAVLHTIFGVLSVRCMAFLETGSGGNMSLYGGMFLMPVFYGAVACAGKKKAADVFDVFTVCMLFTLLCARVNCIWKGCCAGLPIPGIGLRWPTRRQRPKMGGREGCCIPCIWPPMAASALSRSSFVHPPAASCCTWRICGLHWLLDWASAFIQRFRANRRKAEIRSV